ncbi:MAG TPA: type IV pilus twitching motility protein PilT [Candidatus Xenobia bacterium]|jgi:twitching motility protein PilT
MALFGAFGKKSQPQTASQVIADIKSEDAAPSPPAQQRMFHEVTLMPKQERDILALGLKPGYGLNDLLQRLVSLGASDLHLESGNPPILRLKGDMRYTDLPPNNHEQVEKLLSTFPVNEAQREKFEQAGNIDFAYELPGLARFRVNWLKQQSGTGCVARLIPSRVPTIEEMGLPEVLKKVCLSPRGIVLVTGPTGSGKSTTLAAMINYINQNRKAHIITIEDPIEFSHISNKCLIDHREVGHHCKSFASALRSALREDPDIILVGEMRDLETISLALSAAEMGVLVFGTLHTNSATKTIDRIIDVFPSDGQEQVRMQVSQSLRGVVAQQLLKKADGSGRVAGLEIMFVNEGIRSLIREGKTSQLASFLIMGRDEGMQTLDAHLIELVRKGQIRKEDALERAHDLTTFTRAGLITEEQAKRHV